MGRLTSSGRRLTVGWGVRLWLAVVIVWATRMPFLPRLSSWEIVLTPPSGALEIAGNLLLFAPLAFFLARFATVRYGSRRSLVVLGLALVGACLFVEAGQIASRDRLVSPYDLLLNLSGAGLGLWAGTRSIRDGRLSRTASAGAIAGLLALTYAALVGFLCLRVPAAAGGLELRGWEEGHEVVVGDEVGGDRGYVGEVAGARICAPDAGDVICASGGADSASRSALAQAAQTSQAVRLEARVRAASDRQYGPTRIITFSAGPGARNATLGQSGNDLVLRLRTPLSGPNGTKFQFRLTDAVPVGRRMPVEARYREGRVRLSVGSGAAAASREFRLTPTWTWTRVMAGEIDPNHPGQPVWAGAIGLTALLLPIGLTATMFRRTGSYPAAALTAAGACAAAFVAMSLALTSSVPLSWLAISGAVGAAGGSIGERDRRVLCGRYIRGGTRERPDAGSG